jgi:FMN reductase
MQITPKYKTTGSGAKMTRVASRAMEAMMGRTTQGAVREPLIVCIGGTARAASTTERAVRFAARKVEELGGRTEIFVGADLDMPMYAPEQPDRTAAAQRLIAAWRECDGLILASAGYHGAVSGIVKNALDYTEDLAKDGNPYFHGKAVGLIATALHWHAVGTTLVSLRSIVHALRGWPTPLGVAINTTLPVFDAAGDCIAPDIAAQLSMLASQVMDFARKQPDLQRDLPDSSKMLVTA